MLKKLADQNAKSKLRKLAEQNTKYVISMINRYLSYFFGFPSGIRAKRQMKSVPKFPGKNIFCSGHKLLISQRNIFKNF